jgi:hypothetical protein
MLRDDSFTAILYKFEIYLLLLLYSEFTAAF